MAINEEIKQYKKKSSNMAYLSLIYMLDKEYAKHTEKDITINFDICNIFF